MKTHSGAGMLAHMKFSDARAYQALVRLYQADLENHRRYGHWYGNPSTTLKEICFLLDHQDTRHWPAPAYGQWKRLSNHWRRMTLKYADLF